MNRLFRFNSRKSHHRIESMGIRKVIARHHSDEVAQQQSKQRSPTKKSSSSSSPPLLQSQLQSSTNGTIIKCDKSSETEETIPHVELSMSHNSFDDEKLAATTNELCSSSSDSYSSDEDDNVRFIGDVLEYNENAYSNGQVDSDACISPQQPHVGEPIILLALQATKVLLDSLPNINLEKRTLIVGKKELDHMGNSLVEQGEFDQAIEKYVQALYLKSDVLMKHHDSIKYLSMQNLLHLLASVATSINNISFLLHSLGRTSTSDTLQSYMVALQIKQEVLGSDNLSVGKTLNNIGSIHYLQQDFHKAAETYEQARDILKLHLGFDHLDVCTVSANLGDVHCSMKQWSRAVTEYRSALELRWALFGPSDPKVVRLMEQIAELEMLICQQKANNQDGMDSKLNNTRFYGPITKDVRKLQKEVQRDIDHLNTLANTMPLEMIKDKVTVFREIRELMNGENDDLVVIPEDSMSGGQFNNMNVYLSSAVDTTDSSEATEIVDGVVVSEKSYAATPIVAPRSRRNSEASKSPTNLSPEERKEALTTVKEKLAKIRASKEESSSPPILV